MTAPAPLLERVFALPSVPYVVCRKQLPDQPGLYFALRGEELLYIGMATKSIRGRWKTWHLADMEIRKQGIGDQTRIAFIIYRDLATLKADERAAIREFRPALNTNHVPGAHERDQRRLAEECRVIDCDQHDHERWPPSEAPTEAHPCKCYVHDHRGGLPIVLAPQPPAPAADPE